jgi:uncharacterized protein YrrD
MLHNTKDLNNFALSANDGEIGRVKDMYFDDDAWVVRYFVVETGTWLSSRKVLISPLSVQQPNWQEKTLPASITKVQVCNSPNIDTEKPVSRQNEEEYLVYYGYPYYWGGTGLWGDALYPYSTLPAYDGDGPDWLKRQRDDQAALAAVEVRRRNNDPHLRSCESVYGYHVKASDGEIGHVSGYLVDEATWAIRYLIVDTSNWWMGHKVLIAPLWINEMNWSEKTVSASLSRTAIQSSPPYDPKTFMDRAWESSLHRHYGLSRYWSLAEAPETQR